MTERARQPVPLRERRVDLLFLAFFVVNLCFITYVVDLEQLVIDDPASFDPPLWPPAPLVDLVHWYGNTYDPLLIARPPFWRMTIWIDVVFFGPFYLCALYAFTRGRDWVRLPALVWSGTMLANVLIILMEERYGAHATDHFPFVLALNLPWLLMPFAMMWRMRREHPFTRPVATPEDELGGVPAATAA
ncbi:MAG TPA: emopamil-binding family protein [Micromonosporaceae bacterium]|nr:emopamil-binding family protein [Micromonosporaceae bacterium]